MSAIAGRPSHWIEFEAINPSGKPPTAHKLIENTLKDDHISIATFKPNAPGKLLRKSPKASHYAANPFVTQAVRDALLKAARADELPMMQF